MRSRKPVTVVEEVSHDPQSTAQARSTTSNPLSIVPAIEQLWELKYAFISKAMFFRTIYKARQADGEDS